MILILHIVL